MELEQPLPIFARELLKRANDYRDAFKIISSISGKNLTYPAYFLARHSLELYFKSYLASKGCTKNNLTKKYRHDLKMLYNDCLNLNFPQISKLDKFVSNFDSMNKAHDFRYPSKFILQVHSYSIRENYSTSIKNNIEIDILTNAIHTLNLLPGYQDKTIQYKWTD